LKIAILTTVINFDLYEKTSRYFPQNILRYVIDGRNGMHGIHSIIFMMKKLKHEEIDWLVMCDEDVIWSDTSLLHEIIKQMIDNNFIVSGVRDGGTITQRVYNPYAINTFFSVINFSKLQNIWNRQELKKHFYINENEFDDNINHLNGKYDKLSLFEPYYAFYFWLRRKEQKILFLDAAMTTFDEVTNSVSVNNKIILYHTWYARAYGNNPYQTARIDHIIKQIHPNTMQNESDSYNYLIDPYFKTFKQFKKYYAQLFYKFNSILKLK
jgi:hypothetical protein